jgi:CDP-glucose 4,6-dehydratase
MTDAASVAGSRVLVTGGSGFVGSWLCERLLDLGAQVVVARRSVAARSRFRFEGIEERCDLVWAEVTDYASLLRVLNEYEINTVFHLAAQTIVATAGRSPLSTYDSNVRGTYTLLEACRAFCDRGPLKRVVVASSDKAYGSLTGLPYREDFALLPEYPYDVSKACADLIARSYAAMYGLPVAVTRLANVYGGGDTNFSRIVPDTARSLVQGTRPVIRSDGTPQRDFLFISDAVDAYLAIADSLSSARFHGHVWNVGGDRPMAVADLVNRLISISGLAVEPEIRGVGTPSGEIAHQFCDSQKLRTQLGWEPKVDLDTGLAWTYAWYEANLSRLFPHHTSQGS